MPWKIYVYIIASIYISFLQKKLGPVARYNLQSRWITQTFRWGIAGTVAMFQRFQVHIVNPPEHWTLFQGTHLKPQINMWRYYVPLTRTYQLKPHFEIDAIIKWWIERNISSWCPLNTPPGRIASCPPSLKSIIPSFSTCCRQALRVCTSESLPSMSWKEAKETQEETLLKSTHCTSSTHLASSDVNKHWWTLEAFSSKHKTTSIPHRNLYTPRLIKLKYPLGSSNTSKNPNNQKT